MNNVLVVFENKQHLEGNIQKFAEMLKESINTTNTVVNIQMWNNIITTNDTVYKLIGCGFPYCYDLGDKLYGWKFDCIMIHSEVVLTKKVEEYLKSRMTHIKDFNKHVKEPNNYVKEFIEFEL